MSGELHSVAGVSSFSMAMESKLYIALGVRTSILQLSLFLELYMSMGVNGWREADCFSTRVIFTASTYFMIFLPARAG
jgi:hypothetical protein